VVGNLDSFAAGLQQPVADVRLFIALREAAYQRLFGHVPWLRQQLIEAVDAYGRGIEIDPQAISAALADLDPADPESMQQAITGGLFEPKNTDAQNHALRRLETLLALIEGWVDTVVITASQDRMQAAGALAEAVRRRRASGGPAEQTFATLVGLNLRPRRLRDAASLWGALGQLQSPTIRDSLWNHPDLLPTSDDLDDPLGFAASYGKAPELSVPDLATFGSPPDSASAGSQQDSAAPASDQSATGTAGTAPDAPPTGSAPDAPSAGSPSETDEPPSDKPGS
jgi:putative hydrolase